MKTLLGKKNQNISAVFGKSEEYQISIKNRNEWHVWRYSTEISNSIKLH